MGYKYLCFLFICHKFARSNQPGRIAACVGGGHGHGTVRGEEAPAAI